MWVFEEMVDGKELTKIINETHENVKYLKGKLYVIMFKDYNEDRKCRYKT